MLKSIQNIAAMAAGDAGAPSIVAAAIGAGAVIEAKLGAAAVAQAKLKTTNSSVNTASLTPVNLTLPGGEYGFYPKIKMSNAISQEWRAYIMSHTDYDTASFTGWTSYVTNISLGIGTSGQTIYASQRYVTASGEVFWIFILRDKITKQIISMYQAPDHPCMGNGGKPLLIPHPFEGYDKNKYEIIVINPTDEELQKMRLKTIQPEDKPDKDLLEIILEEYKIDETSKPEWPTKKVTVGLPPDWDEAWLKGKEITPIKKTIPKVDYIRCRSLKLISGK